MAVSRLLTGRCTQWHLALRTRQAGWQALFVVGLAAMAPALRADDDATQVPEGPEQPGIVTNYGTPIETGYVFVNGEYLEPPYVLENRDDVLFINSVNTGHALPRPEAAPRHHWGGEGSGWGNRNGGGGSGRVRNPLTSIGESLENEVAQFYFDGQRPIEIGGQVYSTDFLALLIDRQAARKAIDDSLPMLPAFADRIAWSDWLMHYDPPAALSDRIQHELQVLAESESQNNRQILAEKRLQSWAYPLTTMGLVLVVVAFGHLLSARPPVAASSFEIDRSPQAMRLVNWSVVLVLALSGLDLVWTIMVSQTGGMKELNPIGSRLIHDPALLISFKVIATFTAVGIVLAMRQFRRVQLASWWMCLICTVLAVRWLTFNSMFV